MSAVGETAMKKKYLSMIIPAAAAVAILSCHFPYDPEPFVLPEQPYRFPDAGEIQTFFGTRNVKLAYTLKDETGRRSVYCVDFNDSAAVHKKLKKPAGLENLLADSPLFSPDGSFVAYYLTNGAISYGAYIQRLDTSAVPVLVASDGAEPHWWIDPADSQVYIIYSDKIRVDNLTAGVGKTLRQKVSLSGNGTLVGTADSIAPYPMNGGLSKDGACLCTGYDIAAFYNLTTQSLTSINSGRQVCNPSMGPDSVPPCVMMFLNIGGKENLTILDSTGYPVDAFGNVAQHALIFIVDISNTVQTFLPIAMVGSAYYQWQDPEWSNRPDFAAALACLNEAEADGVFLNVATKSTLRFTRGAGKMNATSTPSVWIGN
ncbi:MAG: hypothetical protein JW699_05290 [Chitinispirillaceae bacterium]|nr:hypothetical protein [Chitinispirillaceae bacterium]